VVNVGQAIGFCGLPSIAQARAVEMWGVSLGLRPALAPRRFAPHRNTWGLFLERNVYL
jgi:hypothetical protein